jgi:hypothetical protein
LSDDSVEYVAPKLEGIIAYTNTGTPAGKLKVELYSQNWEQLIDTTYTNSKGYFVFSKSHPGKNYIIHGKPGVYSIKAIVIVSTKENKCPVLITEGCIPPK